jgi:hypothetical protein
MEVALSIGVRIAWDGNRTGLVAHPQMQLDRDQDHGLGFTRNRTQIIIYEIHNKRLVSTAEQF